MAVDQHTLRRDALLVAALHAALALFYWFGAEVTILWDPRPDPWGWFFQNIPSDLLRDSAVQSIWYSHAQPPLWNVLGATLIKVFGSYHMEALQACNILFGGVAAGLSVLTVGHTAGSRRWALAAGLAVALHPALFLYEAFALYTTLVACLVLLAAYQLTQKDHTPGTSALGFVAVMSALILTRSVFHLILLAGVIPLALLVMGRPSRRQLTVLVFLALLPTGWYVKNRVQYGFLGASSWYGMGLWRNALFGQDGAVLRELSEEGAFSAVATLPPFALPSAYEEMGFTAQSEVPVLARDDHQNVNIPAISEAYQRSAVALIKRSPRQYLRNIVTAYGNFSGPSGEYDQIADNRDRLGIHADLEDWLLLRPLVARIEQALGGRYYGSLYFLLLPAVLLAYGFQFTRRVASLSTLHHTVREDAAPFLIAALVAYTTLVSCTMELGENIRFKFMVEPALLVLAAVVLCRATGRASSSEPVTRPPGLDALG